MFKKAVDKAAKKRLREVDNELLQKMREPQKQSETISKGDIALWCLASVMAIALYLAPEKTPVLVCVGLICMAALATHPVLNIPWVTRRHQGFRSTLAMVTMSALVGAYGWFVWPRPHRHTLSQEEWNVFEKPLKEQKEIPEEISLICAGADEAACIYGTQFVNIFRDAGWKVKNNHVDRVTMEKPLSGITLFKKGKGKLDPNNWRSGLWTEISPSLRSVAQAFENLGIEPELQNNPEIPDEGVVIYFGPEKPNESEKTSLTDAMKLYRKGLSRAP
jgi:hypothetical protein